MGCSVFYPDWYTNLDRLQNYITSIDKEPKFIQKGNLEGFIYENKTIYNLGISARYINGSTHRRIPWHLKKNSL